MQTMGMMHAYLSLFLMHAKYLFLGNFMDTLLNENDAWLLIEFFKLWE